MTIRSLLIAIGLLMLGALLSACGGNGDDNGTSTGAANGDSEPTASAPTETPPTEVPTTAPATEPPAQATEPAPPAGGADDSEPATLTVTAVDFGFEPAALTATAGQELTVAFQNTGDLPHSFTIEGVADSGVTSAGSSESVTFTPEAGTYTFFCSLHASMTGTLEVS